MDQTVPDTNRKLFLAGLRNAHAMEKEAQQIIARQLDRLEHYPKVEERLRRHLDETNNQIKRLDEALAALGEAPSGLKDVVTSFVGNLAALGHVPMGDEILKDSFANFAFENFEIAAYKSLFTMGEAVGQAPLIQILEPSLKEEQAMAQWLDDNLKEVTLTYMQLRKQLQDASH